MTDFVGGGPTQIILAGEGIVRGSPDTGIKENTPIGIGVRASCQSLQSTTRRKLSITQHPSAKVGNPKIIVKVGIPTSIGFHGPIKLARGPRGPLLKSMANDAGGILPKGIPAGQAKFNVGIACYGRKTGRGIHRVCVESAKIFVQDLNLR